MGKRQSKKGKSGRGQRKGSSCMVSRGVREIEVDHKNYYVDITSLDLEKITLMDYVILNIIALSQKLEGMIETDEVIMLFHDLFEPADVKARIQEMLDTGHLSKAYIPVSTKEGIKNVEFIYIPDNIQIKRGDWTVQYPDLTYAILFGGLSMSLATIIDKFCQGGQA